LNFNFDRFIYAVLYKTSCYAGGRQNIPRSLQVASGQAVCCR